MKIYTVVAKELLETEYSVEANDPDSAVQLVKNYRLTGDEDGVSLEDERVISESLEIIDSEESDEEEEESIPQEANEEDEEVLKDEEKDEEKDEKDEKDEKGEEEELTPDDVLKQAEIIIGDTTKDKIGG